MLVTRDRVENTTSKSVCGGKRRVAKCSAWSACGGDPVGVAGGAGWARYHLGSEGWENSKTKQYFHKGIWLEIVLRKLYWTFRKGQGKLRKESWRMGGTRKDWLFSFGVSLSLFLSLFFVFYFLIVCLSSCLSVFCCLLCLWYEGVHQSPMTG